MNGSKAPPSCSGTISFSEGVDVILDVANAVAGKVTNLQVSDVATSVVDLHADLQVNVIHPIERIAIRFDIA